MVKSIELPATGFDRCALPAVFGEVSILERYALTPSLPPLLSTLAAQLGAGTGLLAALGPNAGQGGEKGICQLIEFGITREAVS